MNLNELKDRAYKIAREHGWHDPELSDETYLMLIITEIAEAVNAYRDNRHADIEAFRKYEDKVDFRENFKRQIKDTVEDELADVVIRCLDLAGLHSIDLSDATVFIDGLSEVKIKEEIDGTFVELMFEIIKMVSNDDTELAVRINAVLLCIVQLCRAKDIDIKWHVEQKMRYNELRPYRHGGKEY